MGGSKEGRGSTATLYGYPATAGGLLCWCILITGCFPCYRRGIQLLGCCWLLGFELTWLVLAWLFASVAGLGRGAVGPCPSSGFEGGTSVFFLFLVGYTLRCIGGVSSILRVTPSLSLPLGLLGVTPRVACPLPPPSFTFLPVSPRPSWSFPMEEVLAWCSWGEVLLCCVATVFWGMSEICECVCYGRTI